MSSPGDTGEGEAASGELSVVHDFIDERADYVNALKESTEASADYFRWQGHAEARRQLAERLAEAAIICEGVDWTKPDNPDRRCIRFGSRRPDCDPRCDEHNQPTDNEDLRRQLRDRPQPQEVAAQKKVIEHQAETIRQQGAEIIRLKQLEAMGGGFATPCTARHFTTNRQCHRNEGHDGDHEAQPQKGRFIRWESTRATEMRCSARNLQGHGVQCSRSAGHVGEHSVSAGEGTTRVVTWPAL